jgi:hypothetical protein
MSVSTAPVDWDTSKENHRPLKSGRDPATLCAAGPTAELAAARSQHEKAVAAFGSGGGDTDAALAAWYRYVRWAHQTLGSGGRGVAFPPDGVRYGGAGNSVVFCFCFCFVCLCATDHFCQTAMLTTVGNRHHVYHCHHHARP